jgi:hypothetical protein
LATFFKLPWEDLRQALRFISFLIGFSDFRFPLRLWVFISTIQSVLIVQNSEPFSIFRIMVALTGFMSTRNLLVKKMLPGGLFRGKKSISYADIVKLPLSGANAVPILNKKEISCCVGHPV